MSKEKTTRSISYKFSTTDITTGPQMDEKGFLNILKVNDMMKHND